MFEHNFRHTVAKIIIQDYDFSLIKTRRMTYVVWPRGKNWKFDLRSGHDLTQTCHDEWHSIRLDKLSPSNWFWSLHFVSNVFARKLLVIYDDVTRPPLLVAKAIGAPVNFPVLITTTFCAFWLLRTALTHQNGTKFLPLTYHGRSHNWSDFMSKI